MRSLIHSIRQLGIQSHYELWEVFLTRKINFITLIGFFNISVSCLLFPMFGIDDFQLILISCIILTPIVIYLNSRVNYKWGAYSFYLVGIVLMVYFPVKLGMDSYFLLFFFPITLSVVQLLGRRETLTHMIIILSIYLLGTAFVAYCYINDLYALDLDEKVVQRLRVFNILLSSFTALAFIVQITIENQKQERIIKQMLTEKDVLMAEIFHRVKNNMNIVTSLLNLKKNSSNSKDVKDALEECRNRVFSMALVHEKLFKRNHIGGLNFGEYAKDLITEIERSIGNSETDEIELSAEEMELPLQYAIPCGLILNELVTNSYKHARVNGQKLQINIILKENENNKMIIVQDNGPGLNESKPSQPESLGLDLVKSLSEQLNGKYTLENRNGFYFELVF